MAWTFGTVITHNLSAHAKASHPRNKCLKFKGIFFEGEGWTRWGLHVVYMPKKCLQSVLKKTACKIFLSEGANVCCDLRKGWLWPCALPGASLQRFKAFGIWSESQSTALVVRKQEHCLVIVQVLSSNAKSNVHFGPTYICYKLYVMCGRLMFHFLAVFSFGMSLQKLRNDWVCYAFHWRAYQQLSVVSCANQIFTSIYIRDCLWVVRLLA